VNQLRLSASPFGFAAHDSLVSDVAEASILRDIATLRMNRPLFTLIASIHPPEMHGLCEE